MISSKALGWVRFGVALAIILGAWLTVVLFPSEAQGLVNGDFEDGWYYWHGNPTKHVPEGWTPFFAPWEREPEFKRAMGELFPDRVYEGNSAAQWFNNYGVGTGGLYQQVQVQSGSAVTFAAEVQAWSSMQDNPALQTGGSYWTWVGIDPTGGGDWNADTVKWSLGVKHGPPPDLGSYEWAYQAVGTTAQENVVTVFVKGRGEWAAKHNDCQVDAARLEVVCPWAPTPTVVATPTATPTATPIATPMVTITIVPTIEPTPTISPTPNPYELEAMNERILFLETAMEWAMERIAALEDVVQTIKDGAAAFCDLIGR